MKKSKFIAGALVLAMGLLGTGYAYWTDALSINTTVETGKLDVAVAADGAATYKYLEESSAKDGADAYLNGKTFKVDITTKEMNIEIPNMHPGTVVKVPFKVINTSTMPIIGKVTVGDVPATLENLDVTLVKSGTPVAIAETGMNFAQQLEQQFNAAYAQQIEPNSAEVKYELQIKAVGALDQDTLTEELTSQQVNITVDWHQWNDPTANPKK